MKYYFINKKAEDPRLYSLKQSNPFTRKDVINAINNKKEKLLLIHKLIKERIKNKFKNEIISLNDKIQNIEDIFFAKMSNTSINGISLNEALEKHKILVHQNLSLASKIEDENFKLTNTEQLIHFLTSLVNFIMNELSKNQFPKIDDKIINKLSQYLIYLRKILVIEEKQQEEWKESSNKSETLQILYMSLKEIYTIIINTESVLKRNEIKSIISEYNSITNNFNSIKSNFNEVVNDYHSNMKKNNELLSTIENIKDFLLKNKSDNLMHDSEYVKIKTMYVTLSKYIHNIDELPLQKLINLTKELFGDIVPISYYEQYDNELKEINSVLPLIDTMSAQELNELMEHFNLNLSD